VISPDELAAVSDVAARRDVPVHLDGARLFNAAVALGVPAQELTQHVDSVTFCLSKGLACPVGSVLCGSREFIARAHRARKVLGSGMRQAGIIAAAGIVALETMVDRLAEDHINARRLAEGLSGIPGFKVDLERVQTNMVYLDVAESAISSEQFKSFLRERQILAGPTYDRVRLVTHYGITGEDIDYVLESIRELAGTKVQAQRVLA